MEAVRFFLEQHARPHAPDVADSTSFVDRILGGLTDDQMRLRPGKGTTTIRNSIFVILLEIPLGPRPSCGSMAGKEASRAPRRLLFVSSACGWVRQT
jgi:hypothetical protein